ncbi:MAG TPA: MFS transporter [Burkholderiaceae bacterium]|nr:MFS transporter [Burkholderiaceae bacterium]
MKKAVGAFFSLYLATLVLLVGSGLFNTFMGVDLTARNVSETWVGAMIAAYYLGLVFGARHSHKLTITVGHIRAYSASAAIATVAILAQVLVDNLWVWLVLRFGAGLAMVTQFVVLESWLNEQTENESRGVVFAFYMVVSGVGTVLGQLSLTLFGEVRHEPLVFVAMCFVLSLVPVTLTRRIHPALQVPAPLAFRYYLARVPLSMTVLFIAGLITGAFYGLAPVYALKQGLDSGQVAVYLAVSVAAGLIAQWPLGWLADRMSRVLMIRLNALLLLLLGIPLWGWLVFPFWVLLAFSSLLGALQFTLYPLGTAFANDNVEPERRVGLSAIVYMLYGLGACLGPLAAGLLMRYYDSGVYFIFVSACSLVLVAVVRQKKVKGDHVSQDAPTQYVPMPESPQSSAVVASLDPRVDAEADKSHELPTEEEIALDSSPDADSPAPADAPVRAAMQ